jgi:hypothetical protein
MTCVLMCFDVFWCVLCFFCVSLDASVLTQTTGQGFECFRPVVFFPVSALRSPYFCKFLHGASEEIPERPERRSEAQHRAARQRPGRLVQQRRHHGKIGWKWTQNWQEMVRRCLHLFLFIFVSILSTYGIIIQKSFDVFWYLLTSFDTGFRELRIWWCGHWRWLWHSVARLNVLRPSRWKAVRCHRRSRWVNVGAPW